MPSFYCKIISSRLNRLLVLMYGSWFRRKLRSRDESVWTSIFFSPGKEGNGRNYVLESKRILWQYCYVLNCIHTNCIWRYYTMPYRSTWALHDTIQTKARLSVIAILGNSIRRKSTCATLNITCCLIKNSIWYFYIKNIKCYYLLIKIKYH